ncbi:hypothetical protein OSB04_024649 [Centaurea solstitialis]|uniref:CCHC-type domain-containing protein n=1 Tax=Centaurea solstitialis TaxID=347529 RepID=A0AA38W0V5_9ASTR|nr:hypothetical protein OSB04_024649 [Centaurea solstitialis]
MFRSLRFPTSFWWEGTISVNCYMEQPEGFEDPKNPNKVCKLLKSIYGLKQASRSWNLHFDERIKEFGFTKSEFEPCVYTKFSGSIVTFLVLYVDDILLIGNDVPTLQSVKSWLSKCFQMKDLGEAAYILGIKIYRNRSKRLIGLSQSTYIDKVLKRFRMDESKKGYIPMQHGIVLSKTQCPVSSQDQDKMKSVPYASAIGSIMYAMLCTRPDVAYSVSVTSRYQQNPGEPHWVAVKNILKYLRRTKEMFLVFGGSEDEISVTGYSDASFQTDRDDFRSQSGYVFTLNGGAISWKISKQDTIADSTTEAEYIAASDAAKEAVWLRNFLSDLRVVASISRPIDIFCDNSGAVAQAKEPREHHKSRHVLRKYHLIREIIGRGDVRICKIPTEENVADPLTKPLARVKHEAHANSIGMQYLEASADRTTLSSVEVDTDPEAPPPPVRTTAARGKGRGKGRPRKAATVSEGPRLEPEPSHQESSASQPAAFVTHEAFQTEMGKIQDALQTLLNQQEKSKSDGGREDSGMTSPPATVIGGGSQQTPPAGGDLPKSTHGCSYKTFVACKPPTYKGERDPVLAMRWIEEIEMVFETCRCAAENKNVETGGRGTEAVRTMSWKSFVAKFRSQFCPMAATKKMEEEFLQLKQGTLSVQEYTTRFIEKSRIAEVYVPTEEHRVERYIWGLKGNIREFVMGKDPTTFQAAINAAELIEREKDRQISEQLGKKRKWSRPVSDLRGGKAPRFEHRGGQSLGQKPCGKCHRVRRGNCQAGPVTCFQCGKPGHLSRDCPGKRSCFQCGSPDHIRSDCPQLKRGGTPMTGGRATEARDDRKAAPAPARSRAFRMTAEEAEEAPDVVTGMDWMIRNKVKIDCEQKMVRIKLPDGRTAVVYGTKRNMSTSLISVIKANRCIRKGCVWFMAYVVDSGKDKLEVKDVEVVRDYPEVFPEDLVSLPPNREIEFRIDLVPGVMPIVKAPYRLAPSELKEMLAQLQ